VHQFPHHYDVSAAGAVDGHVELSARHLPTLRSASPTEFDGPGNRWSPETLLTAAVGDCFILTFRAVAQASKLPWNSLQCDVTGTLDRIDHVTEFTGFEIHASLDVPPGTDVAQARRLLEKAERTCLISNSLKGTIRLTSDIKTGAVPVNELTQA
jgi:peroxiredoxin-like protein